MERGPVSPGGIGDAGRLVRRDEPPARGDAGPDRAGALRAGGQAAGDLRRRGQAAAGGARPRPRHRRGARALRPRPPRRHDPVDLRGRAAPRGGGDPLRGPLGAAARCARSSPTSTRRPTASATTSATWPSRPATPDGIAAGLGELTRRFAEETGRDVRFAIERPGPCGPLPDEAGQHLEQILREALSNTARHAGDCRVRVSLVLAPDEIDLVVADDGCGVGPVAAGDGRGPGAAQHARAGAPPGRPAGGGARARRRHPRDPGGAARQRGARGRGPGARTISETRCARHDHRSPRPDPGPDRRRPRGRPHRPALAAVPLRRASAWSARRRPPPRPCSSTSRRTPTSC